MRTDQTFPVRPARSRGRSRALEAMGVVAATTAQEMEALIGPIMLAMSRLQHVQPGNPRQRMLLLKALECGERMKLLLRQQLHFARAVPSLRSAVDLVSLMDDIRDLLSSILGPANRLIVEIEGNPPLVTTDRQRLVAVLLHLAADARDAMSKGGSLTIAISSLSEQAARMGLEYNHAVCIAVTHTGMGMDDATLMRVTSLDCRFGASSNAVGLGLSAVGSAVAQLGGKVTVSSSPREGTAVRLLLPSS